MVQKKRKKNKEKPRKTQRWSLLDLRTAAFKTADALEKHPGFKERVAGQVQKNKAFRELVVLLTARRLFKR